MRWRAEHPPPSRLFFLDSHAGIYVAWNGATINLKEHETLHAQWINEYHSFGHFDLTELMHRRTACAREAPSIGRRSFRSGPRRA